MTRRAAELCIGRIEDRLAVVDWSFESSTVRDLTHDLHPWPEKFIPDIPALTIEALTNPGDTVLDPFCGCGTTAVEALRAGRSVVATDLNPLAALITEAKCSVLDDATITRVQSWANELKAVHGIEADHTVPPIPNIEYWFDRPVVAQLAYLRHEIDRLGLATPLLKVVLSSIIVGVSHQESETRYRRIDRSISAHDVLTRFRQRLNAGIHMVKNLRAATGDEPSTARIETADARSFDRTVNGVKVELAVFSPPYPNAFDYHLYHRFRMFWLDMDPRTVKPDEIGAHLNYGTGERWRADMAEAFAAITACVRLGGHVVCVVGDGIIKGEVFRSGDELWAVGESAGLTPLWRTIRPVSRSRRSFNLSDSRLREEHVLIFRR